MNHSSCWIVYCQIDLLISHIMRNVFFFILACAATVLLISWNKRRLIQITWTEICLTVCCSIGCRSTVVRASFFFFFFFLGSLVARSNIEIGQTDMFCLFTCLYAAMLETLGRMQISNMSHALGPTPSTVVNKNNKNNKSNKNEKEKKTGYDRTAILVI